MVLNNLLQLIAVLLLLCFNHQVSCFSPGKNKNYMIKDTPMRSLDIQVTTQPDASSRKKLREEDLFESAQMAKESDMVTRRGFFTLSLPVVLGISTAIALEPHEEACALDSAQSGGGGGSSGGGGGGGGSKPLTRAEVDRILAKAGKKALGGGASGAAAAVVQVLSLMWLRTTMNYQYKYGTGTREALGALWAEGRLPRLYRGLPFALVQGPLSRFGDVAANAGVIAVLDSLATTQNYPLAVKTAAASGAASLWRIFLMPVDTAKTTLQVEGANGLDQLKVRVRENGFFTLYEGALAVCTASFVGNYPWFITYNTLSSYLPVSDSDTALTLLVRSAFIGVCASGVSDCVSNSVRVIKTTKQTSEKKITYAEAAQQVLAEDGPAGLLTRGLQTRLLTNMLQGALFSVAWKYFEKLLTSSSGG